jgi:hypothetical protein
MQFWSTVVMAAVFGFGDVRYHAFRILFSWFLPFRMPFFDSWFSFIQDKIGKTYSFILIFILTLAISLTLAIGLKSMSLNNLYTYSAKNAVYLSVSKLDENQIEKLSDIALMNEKVQARLAKLRVDSDSRLLNYVVPADWYISEIPMHTTESDPQHFLRSSGYQKSTYKIIFSIPTFSCNCVISGKKMISSARTIKPILEVWLDISLGEVIDIKAPPVSFIYENVPVPVY